MRKRPVADITQLSGMKIYSVGIVGIVGGKASKESV